MNVEYLDRLSRLLEKHSRVLKNYDLEFKGCFGAVAGYAKNKIFVSCGKFGVALKLPPETVEKLLQRRGVKRLKYFSKGHIKKDYVVLPARLIENKSKFRVLLQDSIRFVLR